MARLLRMPEVAANGAEAVLQKWAVDEGIEFAAVDVVATVETDKAVVDVEAEAAGVVMKALVPAGALVQVGAPIALLGVPGESVDDLDGVLSELGVAPTSQPVPAPTEPVPPEPEVPPGESVPPEPDVPPEVSTERAEPSAYSTERSERAKPSRGGRVFASPLARRLAREAGILVEEISGTGPGGRITRRDVDASTADCADEPSPVPDAAAPAVAPSAAPASPVAPTEAGFTDVPHSRMRRAIAARLTASTTTTPHFYLRAAVRVDKLMKLRAELNEVASPDRVSVNDLVVKAVARAHVLVPEMNVAWTADAMRTFSAVDVSVAVATPGGLLMPVLRGVDAMSVVTVSTTVKDLVERARSGRLRQEELEGGSISVTNLGMFGTREFAAIINPPQSAILAVGAAVREPVVSKGKVRVGIVIRATLSVDHRAVDGALAAQWMAAFVAVLEKPVQVLF